MQRNGRRRVGALVQCAPTTRGFRVHTGGQRKKEHGERLTHATNARTIRPMTRDVLQTILRASDGIAEKAGAYRVQAEHRVTFYLGSEGRGMTVNEIDEIRLADGYLTLLTRENGTVHTDYPAVFAFSVKPLKNNAPPRAGFA